MFLLKLILRNALRHKLRTSLTVVGVAIAVLAFGLLRTLVAALYSAWNRRRRRGSSPGTPSRSCSPFPSLP